MRRLLPLAALLASLPAAALAGPYDPSFTGLGFLGGTYSQGNAISADGTTVVGLSTSASGPQAFRYDRATGARIGLGDLAGGIFDSRGFGVSANGSVVVGHSASTNSAATNSDYEAFRHTAAGGMTGLGDLATGDFRSQAFGVSGDGTVTVGWGTISGGRQQAFRHTAAGGMVGLGDLSGNGGFTMSNAYGISGDGAVTVGSAASPNGFQAFRHTVGGGMVGLGGLTNGTYQSYALGVSANGGVIVGTSASVNGTREAFRWTAAGGMVGLGDLPTGTFDSQALAVSPDGVVTVGWGNVLIQNTGQSVQHAFIHDSVNGMQDLNAVLTSRGVLPAGWVLSQATGVTTTAEGVPIVTGFGTDPQGRTQGFVAAVPEPASMLALGLGGLALLRRRRKA